MAAPASSTAFGYALDAATPLRLSDARKAEFAAAEQVFDHLCVAHPTSLGKHLSSKEREDKGLHGSTLVYGEIRFEPYAIAFEKIKELYGGMKEPGGVFYDIGSGTGKPVFAAALLHAWGRCIGIEVLTSLHAVSMELLDKWNSPDVHEALPECARASRIDFQQGDATVMDWSDADVIFMNSTCFDDFLMRSLAVRSDRMKVGSFAITFTKRLPSDRWKVLESEVYQMSWGSATVFIQQKVLPD